MSDMDIADIHGIEKLFAGLVFKMLLKENVILEELVENMNSWKHSGYSVHCGEPIKADDTNGRKTLSEYISRAPFSLERMSFNQNSKSVVYKGEHFHPTLARNFDVADPLEWIARITAHIPKKGAKQVIYYGAYSQTWRGRERRQGILPTKPTNQESDASTVNRSSFSRRRRQLWAYLDG